MNYIGKYIVLTILSISLIYLSNVTFGQKKSSPGFYVNNDGDTISAYINVKKWDLNPTKIVVVAEGGKRKFWPEDIQSFTIDNRTFVSATTKVDKSNHIKGTLDLNNPEPIFEVDTIFAELIYPGKKCLFRYKDRNYKLHFFVANSGEPLQPLIFKEYYQWVHVSYYKDSKIVVKNEEYKNQLIQFLTGCDNFSSNIYLANYSVDHLYNLFSRYYQCVGQ